MALDLFAGIAVSDYEAARPWYERLLGSEPSFTPHATEAVWELAEHRYLYIDEDPERAGRAVRRTRSRFRRDPGPSRAGRRLSSSRPAARVIRPACARFGSMNSVAGSSTSQRASSPARLSGARPKKRVHSRCSPPGPGPLPLRQPQPEHIELERKRDIEGDAASRTCTTESGAGGLPAQTVQRLQVGGLDGSAWRCRELPFEQAARVGLRAWPREPVARRQHWAEEQRLAQVPPAGRLGGDPELLGERERERVVGIERRPRFRENPPHARLARERHVAAPDRRDPARLELQKREVGPLRQELADDAEPRQVGMERALVERELLPDHAADVIAQVRDVDVVARGADDRA